MIDSEDTARAVRDTRRAARGYLGVWNTLRQKRIDRLVAAIETDGEVESLVEKLRDLDAQNVAIVREMANLRPVPRLPAMS